MLCVISTNMQIWVLMNGQYSFLFEAVQIVIIANETDVGGQKAE